MQEYEDLPGRDPSLEGDLIDFFLGNKDQVNQEDILQIENIFLSLDQDNNPFYLRLAKLFNHIREKFSIFENVDELIILKERSEEMCQLLQLFFRILYVLENSELELYQLKEEYSLLINQQLVLSLMKIFFNIEIYQDAFSQQLLDNYQKLFCFALNPNPPFKPLERNLTMVALLEINKNLQQNNGQTYQVLDTLILVYLAQPKQVLQWICTNIQQFIQILFEFQAFSLSNSLNQDKLLLYDRLLHLFILIQNDDEVSLLLAKQYKLHEALYEMLKGMEPAFTIKGGSENLSNNNNINIQNSQLLQNAFIILKQIYCKCYNQIDEKFLNGLLQDIKFLIEKGKFQFIYSIIIPIIESQSASLLPICLHQNYDISLVGNVFIQKVKKFQQQNWVHRNNKLKQDSKISSDIFNELEKEKFQTFFQNQFLNKQPQKKANEQQSSQKAGFWNKIVNMNIENVNALMNNDEINHHLQQKRNLVFILNCLNFGLPCKLGVFISDRVVPNAGGGGFMYINKQAQGKNLTAMANDSSFYFYYTEDRQVHVLANSIKVNAQQNKNLNQQQQQLINQQQNLQQYGYQPPNQDPLVQQFSQVFSQQVGGINKQQVPSSHPNNSIMLFRLIPTGLEFYFDNQNIMYLNFGNLELNNFNFPLSAMPFIEGGPLVGHQMVPEEMILLGVEIWHYDMGDEEDNLLLQEQSSQVTDELQDKALQLFTQKENLRNILEQYLRIFRLEEISYLPSYISIEDMLNVLAQIQNKPENKIIISQYLQLKNQATDLDKFKGGLSQLFQKYNSNNVLDLQIINQQNINLGAFNNKDPFELFRKVQSQNLNQFVNALQLFEDKMQGFQIIMSKIQSILMQIENQSLFSTISAMMTMLQFQQFKDFLIKENNFFRILLNIVHSLNQNNVGGINWCSQKIAYILIKCLYKLLRSDKSQKLREEIFNNNIFDLILNFIEMIIGQLPQDNSNKNSNMEIEEQKQKNDIDNNNKQLQQQQTQEKSQSEQQQLSQQNTKQKNISKVKKQKLEKQKEKQKTHIPKGVGYGLGSDDMDEDNEDVQYDEYQQNEILEDQDEEEQYLQQQQDDQNLQYQDFFQEALKFKKIKINLDQSEGQLLPPQQIIDEKSNQEQKNKDNLEQLLIKEQNSIENIDQQYFEEINKYISQKNLQKIKAQQPKNIPKGVGYGGGSIGYSYGSYDNYYNQKLKDQQDPYLQKKDSEEDYSSNNKNQNQSLFAKDKEMGGKCLKNLYKCLLHLFINEFELNMKIYENILNSSLFRIFVHVLKTNSFVDCTKQPTAFTILFQLLKTMAKQENFLDLFVKTIYDTSLYESIEKMTKQASFYQDNFNSFQANNKVQKNQAQSADNQKKIQEQKEKNTELFVKCFLDSFQSIENQLQINQFIEITEVKEDNQLQNLQNQKNDMELQYEQFYPQMMKPLCIDSFDMKNEQGQFNHHYKDLITNQNPPKRKIDRLVKEISDLGNSLPIQATDAIFVRFDKQRMDLMKSCIFGASNTPYAHGAFIYDICFCDEYPDISPKVNLMTTGNGAVRFNPNLYNCGKVCLSLLGTWHGSSTENWNPKQSTILQVLISIQAMVMSEYVYFNEPGWQNEMGSPQGELKNKAYNNIVKISNIRYAMIDQIRKPHPGFEEVILKSFYLKKDMILKEVKQWITQADEDVSYNIGQNPDLEGRFVNNKKLFKLDLTVAVADLEKELENLRLKIGKDINNKFQGPKKQIKLNKQKPSIGQQNIKNRQQKIDERQRIGKIEDIDVSYDSKEQQLQQQQKQMNVEDIDFKNRFSRAIFAVGLDALAKQAKSSVLLAGIGAIGQEIAKNIVLSGVKRFTIFDNDIVKDQKDLCGQFFLTSDDIGKNKALCCLNKIQQLNSYVRCDVVSNNNNDQQVKPIELIDLIQSDNEFQLKNYNVIILCNQSLETAVIIDEYCRLNKIAFINVECYGLCHRVFCDFGDNFSVLDKDGEQALEYTIRHITHDQQGIVTLIEGAKHNLQDGDIIEMREVVDENEQQFISLNGQKFQIKVLSKNSFMIGDTSNFKKYIRNGVAKQIKQSVTMKYDSLSNNLEKPVFEQNVGQYYDQESQIQRAILHICFLTLSQFKQQYNRLPEVWNYIEDIDLFYKLFLSCCEKSAILLKELQVENLDQIKNFQQILLTFIFTCNGILPANAAICGAMVAQEAIKSVTNKWMPLNQIYIHQEFELFPDINFSEFIKIDNSQLKVEFLIQDIAQIQQKFGFQLNNDRYDPIRLCCGNNFVQNIRNSKLFMVGAGAIGCELLKNYAMIGFGTQNDGLITLTDPDIIENSNLNRQFLFREKHIRKPKSVTAAAAVVAMNKDLQNHINPRLDKVHDQTEHIFDEEFFNSLSIVTNALDNVHARRYVDQRCVKSRKPLLESGTLGPKGNVQVIIPFKTESYSEQEDPNEENEIPHCTLKMFPEEPIHCVEWARDKFARMFTQKPNSLVTAIISLQKNQFLALEVKTLKDASMLQQKRSKSFEDCLSYAFSKFHKYFNHDIQQLLLVYPLDKTTKEGQPFWTLPKRPPKPLEFDSNNNLHLDFVISCAALRAASLNIQIPQNIRSAEFKQQVRQAITQLPIPKFCPKQEKLQAIQKEVEKEADKEEKDQQQQPLQQQQAQITKGNADYAKEIVQNLNEYFQYNDQTQKVATLKQIQEGQCAILPTPIQFEKDEDLNFHIDFLYAMTNCRGLNYSLEFMDWLTVKQKAGRIIPALATTTAAIAGLQTIELCKYFKGCKLEQFKNSFINMSIPLLAQSEPGELKVYKLTDQLKASVWDRWDIKIVNGENDTLEKLYNYLFDKFEIYPNDLQVGPKIIYIFNIMNQEFNKQENQKILNQNLLIMLKQDLQKSIDQNSMQAIEYVDKIITFTHQDPIMLLNQKQINDSKNKKEKEYIKGVPFIRLIFSK